MASESHIADTSVDANALYNRATVAEHARDFDSAFTLYLSAAQAYLHRARTLPAQRAAERAKCKTEAGTCIARAELIKAARKGALKPPTRDPFSRGSEEQEYVLDKSSKVNGVVLFVWSDGDARCSKDPDSSVPPPFGAELSSLSPVWRRPQDTYAASELSLAGPTLDPRHIRQNIVTDCSVCSAAAICLHHHRIFGSKLGLSCMSPSNSEGLPSISPDGTYNFRLFVNGAFRKISIDDRLPFTTDGRPLSVMATLEDGTVDLWPALLEKAYMKLMGGYDFPGSNSSIDVHTLAGWIPEHIEINSSTFVREKAFRRIHEGFNRGSCVLTLGTGTRGNDIVLSVSALDGSQTQLLSTHSYAVLAIHEEPDGRRLTILNPWNASRAIHNNLEILEDIDRLSLMGRSDSRTSPHGREIGSGSGSANLIDVSWDEVCTVFDGLYLNWDPALFKSTTRFHGSWRAKARDNLPECVHHYLTLDLSSRFERTQPRRKEELDLWVLLTRHIVDKQRSGEFIAVHAVQIEREEAGHDIGIVDASLDLKGSYTSSTHVLTRLTVIGPLARVALIASYDGPYADVCFSVQAFADSADLTWVVQPRKTTYERSIEGTFSSRNAGGNSTYPTFMNNPQYRLRLHQENGAGHVGVMEKTRKSMVRLIVEGPRDVPLNAMLIWRSEEESQERVSKLRPGDTIASSGPYSYGVAQLSASVTPSDYCIVVSTFEPRHRGKFTLRIESAARMDVEDIPVEGAGMFCKTFKGAWKPGMDGGSPRFGSYNTNPMFEIDVRTATALKLRLQLAKPSSTIALNVTLFASTASCSTPYGSPASSSTKSSPSSLSGVSSPPGSPSTVVLDRQIATSGAYMDGTRSPAGVVTPQTKVAPGKYLAVVSTFDPGIHAAFQLLVFSKADVKVSPLHNY